MSFKVGDMLTPKVDFTAFTAGRHYIVQGVGQYGFLLVDDDGDERWPADWRFRRVQSAQVSIPVAIELPSNDNAEVQAYYDQCRALSRPIMTTSSEVRCDCGAEKAQTTHAFWCSTNASQEQKRTA